MREHGVGKHRLPCGLYGFCAEEPSGGQILELSVDVSVVRSVWTQLRTIRAVHRMVRLSRDLSGQKCHVGCQIQVQQTLRNSVLPRRPSVPLLVAVDAFF